MLVHGPGVCVGALWDVCTMAKLHQDAFLERHDVGPRLSSLACRLCSHGGYRVPHVADPAARGQGPTCLLHYGISTAPLVQRSSLHTTEGAAKSEKLWRRKAPPPITEKVAVDQCWSVYPLAAPLKTSPVSLSVQMSYPGKKRVPMAKEGNLELVKISNFLHLTPAAI